MEWTRNEYRISTNRQLLDLDVIHGFLTRSYWANGRSRDKVSLSIENSLPLGLYQGDVQIGFSRVLTDYAVFAWLADVFVLEEYRGRGLGSWLVEVTTSLPELRRIRRWHLATHDAHELYRRVGFSASDPGMYMDRINVDNK